MKSYLIPLLLIIFSTPAFTASLKATVEVNNRASLYGDMSLLDMSKKEFSTNNIDTFPKGSSQHLVFSGDSDLGFGHAIVKIGTTDNSHYCEFKIELIGYDYAAKITDRRSAICTLYKQSKWKFVLNINQL